MWYLTEPTIKEEADELFSFPHTAETLDNIHKLPICAEPKPLTGCLKTANIDLEPKGFSLASTICTILLVIKSFHKEAPQDYPNTYI